MDKEHNVLGPGLICMPQSRRHTNLDCTSFAWLQIIGLIIWGIAGLVMVVMGAVFKDDCPIQPHIPIFLIITGIAQVLVGSFLLLKILHQHDYVILNALLFFVLFGWFALGSFWVFSMFDQKDGKCARSLYLFAYGVLAFEWIMIWVPCLYYTCYTDPIKEARPPALGNLQYIEYLGRK